MKKRKVKCPECKGLGVINKATPVFYRNVLNGISQRNV